MLYDIRKILYDIEKLNKITRSDKNKLLKELNSISTDLKLKRKNMISDCRDDNYANIDDIEYIFGDIDSYYQPVLASSFLTMITKGTISEETRTEICP